jgi:hypothetical protein
LPSAVVVQNVSAPAQRKCCVGVTKHPDHHANALYEAGRARGSKIPLDKHLFRPCVAVVSALAGFSHLGTIVEHGAELLAVDVRAHMTVAARIQTAGVGIFSSQLARKRQPLPFGAANATTITGSHRAHRRRMLSVGMLKNERTTG